MIPAIPLALVLGFFVVRWAMKGKIKPLPLLVTLLFGMSLGLTPLGPTALGAAGSAAAWVGEKAASGYELLTTR